VKQEHRIIYTQFPTDLKSGNVFRGVQAWGVIDATSGWLRVLTILSLRHRQTHCYHPKPAPNLNGYMQWIPWQTKAYLFGMHSQVNTYQEVCGNFTLPELFATHPGKQKSPRRPGRFVSSTLLIAFSCDIGCYGLNQCTQEVTTAQAQQLHSQVPRAISLEITEFGDRDLLQLMNLNPAY